MSENGETIQCEELNEAYEKRVDDNKLRIEVQYDNIKFILLKELSHYKHIKEYTYEDIIKELDLS